jgi:hypothetical protein
MNFGHLKVVKLLVMYELRQNYGVLYLLKAFQTYFSHYQIYSWWIAYGREGCHISHASLVVWLNALA